MKKLNILFSLAALLVLFLAPAQAVNYNVSDEAGFNTALGSVVAGDSITVTADFNISQRININVSDLTVMGGDFTLTPTFTKTSNSNNATFGIFGDNITIENLTIDGVNGTSLHGINIYVAENTMLDNVTVLNNDNAGIVVNGSTVTVNDVTTSGNGWGGINVDQGGGVTQAAMLTITGDSSHDEASHIWLDDMTKDVSVVDVEGQYSFEDFGNLRLYTLIAVEEVPENMSACKKDGWMSFSSLGFKNQGACVSYVQSNNNAGKR